MATAGTDRSDNLSPALEALLLMATEPQTEQDLAAAVGAETAEVAGALAQLAEFYRQTGRGFELRHVGAGWRYYTRSDLSDVIGQAVLQGAQGRLTQASLETLAVIAYLQPISRARVSAVRGVNVDGVVRTLLARDLIAERGKDVATGAGLLETTPYFLERLGLTNLEELPPLAPNLPDAASLERELHDIVATSLGGEESSPMTAAPADAGDSGRAAQVAEPRGGADHV